LLDQPPPAGEQILGAPRRDQHRHQPARIPADHGQHRQLRRPAGLPEPHRQLNRRKRQVTLRDLAAAYAVRDAGSGGRYAGRNSATRLESTRIDLVQPIRPAITVTDIPG